MTIWLLDTDTISDVVRNPFGKIAQRVAAAENETICTSIIVACELRFGAEKRNAIRLSERIGSTLASLDVKPLNQDADHHYARLRADLERKSTPIGRNDMLIAAHTLALNAVLVTANTREFARIEGLKLENWLE